MKTEPTASKLKHKLILMHGAGQFQDPSQSQRYSQRGQYDEGILPYSAASAQSPLNVSSGISGSLDTTPTSANSGILADDIRVAEAIIFGATMPARSGEPEITFHEYSLASLLCVLGTLKLAPSPHYQEERTVTQLLLDTVGAHFKNGSFHTWILNMLEDTKGYVLDDLAKINPDYANSARELAAQILGFKPLSALLLAVAQTVQLTIYERCRAFLVLKLHEIYGNGQSLHDNEVIDALLQDYAFEYRRILNEDLPDFVNNPVISQRLAQLTNGHYAEIAYHLQATYQNTDPRYRHPPGYITHSNGDLLQDLFRLAEYNSLYEQNIGPGTALSYLRSLHKWDQTSSYYQSLQYPLDNLPRGVRAQLTLLQESSDFRPRTFGTPEHLSLPHQPADSVRAPSRYQPQAVRRAPAPQSGVQYDEWEEQQQNYSYSGFQSFINTLFDVEPPRAIAIAAITFSAAGLSFLGADYNELLIGLGTMLLSFDRPERFDSAAEKLSAYAIRGLSTGAFVAGVMIAPLPHVGELRYLLRFSADYYSLLLGAAIISEVFQWVRRLSPDDREIFQRDDDES